MGVCTHEAATYIDLIVISLANKTVSVITFYRTMYEKLVEIIQLITKHFNDLFSLFSHYQKLCSHLLLLIVIILHVLVCYKYLLCV